eukprot:413483_1
MAHSTSTISSKAGGRGGRKVGVAPPPRRLAPPDDEDTTIDIYGSSAASPPAKSSDRRSSGSERPSHTMFAAVVASDQWFSGSRSQRFSTRWKSMGPSQCPPTGSISCEWN